VGHIGHGLQTRASQLEILMRHGLQTRASQLKILIGHGLQTRANQHVEEEEFFSSSFFCF